MRKKILFVMYSFAHGGAEYQIGKIAQCCKRKGFDVFYAIEDRGISAGKQNCLKDDVNENIYHMNLGSHFVLWGELLFYFKMFFYLLRNKIDYVFLYEQYGLLSIPLFKLFGKKIIYSERNSGEWLVKRWIYRLVLNLCTVLTCNSSVAQKNMDGSLKKKTIKINNFVDIPTLTHRECNVGLSRTNVSILVPARISPEKNQLVLLRCLLKYKIDFVKEIKFVGKIDCLEYKNEMQNVLNMIENRECVKFEDFNQDREKMYEDSDVVILPSLSEGTPNVVLECFARRKIIIASDIRQNSELFDDDCFLFDPLDPASLKDCLYRVLSIDEKRMENFLSRNFEYLLENFSEEKGPQKYVELFENMEG